MTRLPRLFRLVVRLYPGRFRARYEAELLEFLAEDYARAGFRGRWRFWFASLTDAVVTALRIRWNTRGVHRRRPSYVARPRLGDVMFGFGKTILLAVRRWRREPGFALVAIATLALGIGATASVFSLAHTFFLRPLPYPAPDRLVMTEVHQNERFLPVSYPDYRDWRDQTTVVEELAVFRQNPMTLSTREGAVRVTAQFASPPFLRVLGATPVAGRAFTDDDDRAMGAERVAVISHALWEREFGRAADAVGRTIRLNEESFTVIGVLAREFTDPFGGGNGVDLWLPISMWPLVDAWGPVTMEMRKRRMFAVIGRVGAGHTIDEGRRDIAAVAERLAAAYPAENENVTVTLIPLRDAIAGDLQGPTMVLLAGAGFLLLVGCVNVASLLLVRATGRSREAGVRLALGASTRHLLGDLVGEAAVLGGAGVVAGVLAAHWTTDALLAFSGVSLPPYVQVQIGGPVILVAAAIAVGVVAGISVLPGLVAARTDVNAALAGGRGDAGDGRKARSRHALIVCEVATTVVILVGSGLLLRSFQTLRNTDVGYRTERTLTALADLSGDKYATNETLLPFGRLTLDRLASLPGVESADIWSRRLPGQSFSFTTIVTPEQTVVSQQDALIGRMHLVTPGAVNRMGLRLLAGRWLEESDRQGTESVGLISESLANTLWPDNDPIGKTFRRFALPGSDEDRDVPWVRVVGVVSDARFSGRTAAAGTILATPYDVYYSWWQRPQRQVVLVVRAVADPKTLTASVRRAMREVDPDIALYDFGTLDEVVREEEHLARFQAAMMGAFGGFALVLTALGIYGVLSYNVSRRVREIGLRTALGASRRATMALFLRQGLTLTAVGTAVGLLIAFAASRLVASVLFGVTPWDPWSYLAAPAALLTVAALACYLPTRRAAAVDPMTALRRE